jgi:hypothetical protein
VRSELTAEDVRKLLRYDPKTGKMFWRLRPNGRVPEGSEAGTVTKRGRVRITIGRKSYFRYRLIWLLKTGQWPSSEIDHRNGDPMDCTAHLLELTDGKYNGKWKEQ